MIAGVPTVESAGVTSISSCLKKLMLAGISSMTKIAVTTDETAVRISETRGEARRTRTESRMCSSRRYATTEPSMASHKNRIVPSSSVHTSGARST